VSRALDGVAASPTGASSWSSSRDAHTGVIWQGCP
jgi:hypothetical protein